MLSRVRGIQFNKLNTTHQNTAKLKVTSLKIWDNLPDKTIRKSVLNFH